MVELNLAGNGLGGTLPDTLGRLSYLERLDLSGNAIKVPEWGSLGWGGCTPGCLRTRGMGEWGGGGATRGRATPML